jgi:putative FmdB family regulatory protein
MPRYRYGCQSCESTKIVFHLIGDETAVMCDECESKMAKIITNSFSTSEVKNKKNKIGQVTKEYIEKNREILEQQKKELVSETYE